MCLVRRLAVDFFFFYYLLCTVDRRLMILIPGNGNGLVKYRTVGIAAALRI